MTTRKIEKLPGYTPVYDEPPMPDHIRHALYDVVDYLWHEELNHCQAAADSNPNSYLGEHIFVKLCSIRAWLECRYIKPEHYIEL